MHIYVPYDFVQRCEDTVGVELCYVDLLLSFGTFITTASIQADFLSSLICHKSSSLT